MDSEIRPGADFYAVIAKLRGASPNIRKTLNQEIKSATAPIERAAKSNIMGIESQGMSGGGSTQRGDANASRSKKGARGKTGLRESIAKGVTRKITYSGYRTGVRVRVDKKYLPTDQESLIRATNRGTVRHPVYGNRDVWVSQKFTPPGWFNRAIRDHGPEAVRKIKEAARKALHDLG